ncbi:MAG: restriction endonuclease [Abditibacteriota bacterium]|nr:restriction endonuclease [Abditibacteriota bacterium]
MKYFWFILIFLIIWIVGFCELVTFYPLYLPLIIVVMLGILAYTFIIVIFSAMMKTKGVADYKITKKLFEKGDKLSKRKYRELVKRFLYSRGYDRLKIAKKNPYGVRWYDKEDIIILIKDKEKADPDVVTRAEEGAIAFGTPRAIIISHKGFTNEAVTEAQGKNIFLWDTKRIIEMLARDIKEDEERRKTKRIKPDKAEKTHIEALDSCSGEEFKELLCKIMESKYEFKGKEEEYFKFVIDDKVYMVYPLKAPEGERLKEKDVESIFCNIYEKGYSNAMVVTNGYYNQNIEDMSRKLQIDVWSRDNIIYLLK